MKFLHFLQEIYHKKKQFAVAITYIEKLDVKTAKSVENAAVNFFKRTSMSKV